MEEPKATSRKIIKPKINFSIGSLTKCRSSTTPRKTRKSLAVNVKPGQADRMFHSMEEAWESSSRNNMADVREFIPEFFYLPDFLTNRNKFDLETKQSGEPLNYVHQQSDPVCSMSGTGRMSSSQAPRTKW